LCLFLLKQKIMSNVNLHTHLTLVNVTCFKWWTCFLNGWHVKPLKTCNVRRCEISDKIGVESKINKKIIKNFKTKWETMDLWEVITAVWLAIT